MKPFPMKLGFIILLAGIVFLPSAEAWGDDWVFYGGSSQDEVKGSVLRDWYTLNRLKPVPKNAAAAHHYFDRDSIGSNYPYAGGIVRLWEKAVLQRGTQTYEQAREEVRREEEARLKRKLTVLDYAWLFPHAVNRATKEIQTLYEIKCDTKEFFIMEVNYYDKADNRMIRETNMEMTFWIPVRPGTLMESLQQEVCKNPD